VELDLSIDYASPHTAINQSAGISGEREPQGVLQFVVSLVRKPTGGIMR
jgi:hypothetical protein